MTDALAGNASRCDAATCAPEQLAEYAGTYADPGQSYTLTQTDAGLELTIALIDQPGAWSQAQAINAPLPPTAAVAFLDTDMAVAGPQRLPFVRNAGGRVAWISSGLRLLPRVEEEA